MAFIIVHSVLKKRSQLYSQVHGCSKHHVNFTLNTSKQLKPLRACGMYVPTSKKINFSSSKHTWLARTTARLKCSLVMLLVCPPLSALFLVSWFYSFWYFLKYHLKFISVMETDVTYITVLYSKHSDSSWKQEKNNWVVFLFWVMLLLSIEEPSGYGLDW